MRAFSQTRSMERLVAKPWWRMSAGMLATSPGRIKSRARGLPVSLSSTSHSISSVSWTDPGRAGFLRRREGIESGAAPTAQDGLAGGHGEGRIEFLDVREPGLVIRLVVPAGEELHPPVQVAASEHRVEVHPAVEETPGHIAHQRAQERICRHAVLEPALRRRPAEVDEVVVAQEVELSQLESAEAGLRVGLAHHHIELRWPRRPSHCCRFGHCHGRLLQWVQISAHFCWVRSPRMVCWIITEGRAALNWYAAPLGSRAWWPRLRWMRPIFLPFGGRGRRWVPSLLRAITESPGSTNETVTSPSITTTNSSWLAANQSEVPSARIASIT